MTEGQHTSLRSFAVIPAAGVGRRMGQTKLLLPVAGRPLILHTIAAWQRSRIDKIVVVARPDDDPLADIVRRAGVELVVPAEPPPEMKASLILAIEYIRRQFAPAENDAWLVAPADMPGLSTRVIDALIVQTQNRPDQVLLPTLAGRRGHPVLLPWRLADSLSQLSAEEGLNALIDRHDPLLVPCDAFESHLASAFADIDTPDDLARFRGENGN